MAVSIGNKIELVQLEQIIKNDPNKKVYVSKVFDIYPNKVLQIAMPILEGKIIPLGINEKYSVCFYTSKGLLQCNAIITSRYKSNNIFYLEILLLEEPAKVQRRKFYRYKCLLGAKMRVVSDEEYDKGFYENPDVKEEDLEFIEAKIMDISGGGLKIVTKTDLEKNEVVKICFDVIIIEEHVRFKLYARVLASSLFNGRKDVFEQRLEFLKIGQEERDKIIKYIFESERLARSKGIGVI